MKKILTFIPLGVGISAAIIYIFNVIQFRVINNSITLLQILSNLKIYLYVSIAGFILYFLIRIIDILSAKKENLKEEVNDEEIANNDYEPFEISDNNKINNNAYDSYIPNYDYVPMYNKDNLKKEEDIKKLSINEEKSGEEITVADSKYCYNCGELINYNDKYCSSCGTYQLERKKQVNPLLKNIINVLEIVILILIIYFSLNMLFDYKESKDSNFKSPFKISMTK